MCRILVLSAVVLMMVSPCVAHADEFGTRFYGHAPAGLGDFTAPKTQTQDIAADESTAIELQKIMPAAGEEKPKAAKENVPTHDKK